MTGLTDKEAEKMRFALDVHEAKKAEEAKAANLDFLKDIAAVVNSKEYASVEAKLKALRAKYMDDHNIFVQVNCILTAMPNLAFEIARRTNG